MPRYMVVIKEVHESYRTVFAESKEEAKQLALDDAGLEINLRYVRTLGGMEDIDVEEISD